MPKPKFGRGHKAPYETTHVRVPVPIQEMVQEFVDEWKELRFSEQDKLLTALEEGDKFRDRIELERVTEIAQNCLKQKRSARVTLSMFLSRIYQENITL